jgi:hypothetical protein
MHSNISNSRFLYVIEGKLLWFQFHHVSKGDTVMNLFRRDKFVT